MSDKSILHSQPLKQTICDIVQNSDMSKLIAEQRKAKALMTKSKSKIHQYSTN